MAEKPQTMSEEEALARIAAASAPTTGDELGRMINFAGSEVFMGNLNIEGIRDLDETETGDGALGLEDVGPNPVLLLGAVVEGTTWDSTDGDGSTRDGHVCRMLAILEPDVRPLAIRELHSESDEVARQLQSLIDQDGLSPARPILVRFESVKTRKNFTVFKLRSVGAADKATFQRRLSATVS